MFGSDLVSGRQTTLEGNRKENKTSLLVLMKVKQIFKSRKLMGNCIRKSFEGIKYVYTQSHTHVV